MASYVGGEEGEVEATVRGVSREKTGAGRDVRQRWTGERVGEN